MEEHYENVGSYYTKEVQLHKSLSSSSGEYAEIATNNEQDASNQYAIIEDDVGIQLPKPIANRNGIVQPEEKNKVLKIALPSGKKESCICCTTLTFFLIIIVFTCALTAYNYYHLELLKLQLKFLLREFNQLEESSTKISEIQETQLNITENMELLNVTSTDQYNEYDTKIMKVNRKQLKLFEDIQQLNVSTLEQRSQIYYSLIHNVSLNSNISDRVNNFLDNIGLHENFPADSCRYIHVLHPSWPSGYYWVINQHGAAIYVYCYMGISCHPNYSDCFAACFFGYFDCTLKGWVRIAKLNKNGNRTQCFVGLNNYPTNTSSCVTESNSATCSSTFFSSFNVSYSRIHGSIRAYGVGTPDGFRSSSLTINENYVDGISLTVGNTTNRQHIHTFVPASGICYTLSNRPSFVSYHSDYGCLPVLGTGSSQCSGYSCSQQFHKALATPTTDNVEMRVCRDQSRSDEDIIIEDIEIYLT